jgi:hypothetical protein
MGLSSRQGQELFAATSREDIEPVLSTARGLHRGYSAEGMKMTGYSILCRADAKTALTWAIPYALIPWTLSFTYPVSNARIGRM